MPFARRHRSRVTEVLCHRWCAVALAALVWGLGTGCFGEPTYDGLACSVEKPCPNGYVCLVDGTCHRRCHNDVDCEETAESCREEVCVLTSTQAGLVIVPGP